MCFPIDAVGKLVYDNTIEFERILFLEGGKHNDVPLHHCEEQHDDANVILPGM